MGCRSVNSIHPHDPVTGINRDFPGLWPFGRVRPNGMHQSVHFEASAGRVSVVINRPAPQMILWGSQESLRCV